MLHVLAATPRAARDWEWAAHLPHVSDADDGRLPRIAGGAADVAVHVAGAPVARREPPWRHVTGSGLPAATAPDVVVVLDGASALRSVPGVADLLRDGPDSGLAFVCLD